MTKPKISTYREIVPLIYSWSTPDIPKYQGWEKIGYTEQGSADTRIAQQASQLAVEKEKKWVRRAIFNSEAGGRFTDRDFHEYLRQQGIPRQLQPKRTEWHHFEGAPKSSLDYFNAFAGQDFASAQGTSQDDYVLRPEQQAAVDQALAAFNSGESEALWNAKPRFGKTLATYELLRQLGAVRVLIVTNRPAIANSWFDDYAQFIAHQTTYQFVSDSPSLAARTPITREQWLIHARNNLDKDPRIIEFVSLQDLKGSQYFGGNYPKLKHIADFNWDVLVIDEAHEGIDTTRTDVAFDQITRTHTLHLSGTPFKALASGKFSEAQIFNWTYLDEQIARQGWTDDAAENPYAALPTLNMLTYQVSRMITDQLSRGMALDEKEADIDYAFDLNEFFSTKENGFFKHEAEVIKFLDSLTTNEKYPFSTPELRDEIRHSFWLLDRVASAKALERILKKHPVFENYTIILAAGDGRSDDADLVTTGKSLDNVRAAIDEAERTNGKTITLSVGQLTTGVTVPEWTAVLMLSNIASPALYMQAAFRAQNPSTFERAGKVLQKKNAYIFDFAPERTLTIFDAFANNLSSNPSDNQAVRQENIRQLLNFFPIIGEDSEGRMVELDAAQVLTFPQVFKAKEVVRRGFLSNLLFDNVTGIFRYSDHVKEILEKLPTMKQGRARTGQSIDLPEPPPSFDSDGNVLVDAELVINPKIAGLGKPIWQAGEVPAIQPEAPADKTANEIARLVTTKAKETREKLKEEYGLTVAQIERDEKQTEARVKTAVERALMERQIANKHFDDAIKEAATEAEARAIENKRAEHDEAFQGAILALVTAHTDEIATEVVTREETKKERKRVNETMDDVRSHLRGFARTIPLFLMAYGDRNTRLANLDDYTPDDVFEEITGITEAEFRLLRDGHEVTNEDGSTTSIPGLFDEAVFDQAIQEFLNKKEALADYFDESQTENIFAYIPQPETSLVFTPQAVVKQMVDVLEAENPGIFEDPTKTFADLFSTAGLFLMELVRRLDAGLATRIPDPEERLRHILTTQLFEMSHNEVLHRITIEAVSGGVPERRDWLLDSGHFRVGNLAEMSPEERQQVVNDMLTEGKPTMSKKFDVVIGNPPYQDEATGDATHSMPIYHLFMDAAYAIGRKVVLITPARFLFNAGYTPKAWNKKMLSDKHVSVPIYVPNSNSLFPKTDIKGGIAVTYRDEDSAHEPIGTFTKYPELNEILQKVAASQDYSLASSITSSRSYRYTDKMHADYPDIASTMSKGEQFKVNTRTLEQLSFLYHEYPPTDGHDYVRMLGLLNNARVFRWLRSDYITGPDSFATYKIAISKATGTGTFGEVLSTPLVLEPNVAVTQSFITIGSFKELSEAEACLKYVKSKFARTMLGVLKITQDLPAKVWEHVPLQDFTDASDIDWTQSIPKIDQQLYAKYKLTADEVAFIEAHVQAMQ